MQQVFSSFAERPLLALGVGAFLCGLALFYVLVQRNRKHRIKLAHKLKI
jgi:hypothetical protein